MEPRVTRLCNGWSKIWISSHQRTFLSNIQTGCEPHSPASYSMGIGGFFSQGMEPRVTRLCTGWFTSRDFSIKHPDWMRPPPPSLLFNGYRGFLSPRYKADHSLMSSCKVKNKWNYTTLKSLPSAAQVGSQLLVFQENIALPQSRVKHYLTAWPLKMELGAICLNHQTGSGLYLLAQPHSCLRP